MTWRYPTAFTSWGPEEADAIVRVVNSGLFTMGDQVAAFEHELAAYHGVKHAIMVNSGSSANLIAVGALFYLESLGRRLMRGDRVIVPALAWPTLYAPLVQNGLSLLVADADETWNMERQPLAPASDVALIVGCSILGNPMDAGWWAARAKRSSAIFLEDNCESIGAAINGGKMCGTFGLMGTLSFYYSHQISAIEGGAVITNDDECATLCRMLRNHGWTKGTARQPKTFAGEYDFEVMGWNVRPLELHAAIAREQLRKLDRFGLERNRNYNHFLEAVADLPIGIPQINPGARINPFGIAFTVADPALRSVLAMKLREKGIDCRPPVGGSFAKHRYARHATWSGRTPVADRIHDTGLFIGNAPFPITELIDEAVDIMRSVL